MVDEPRTPGDAGQAVLREAANWAARGELGPSDQKRFEAWLSEPLHALAFARVLEAVGWAALASKGEPGQDGLQLDDPTGG